MGNRSQLPVLNSLMGQRTPAATQKARSIYAGFIGIAVGSDMDRERRLFAHQNLVCDTAKKTASK